MTYGVIPLALCGLDVLLFLMTYRMALSPHHPIPSSPHLFVLMDWANFFMDATHQKETYKFMDAPPFPGSLKLLSCFRTYVPFV